MSSYFRALSLLCVHDNYISIIGYYTLASAISDIHAQSLRATGTRAWSMYIGYCTSGGVITCLSLLKPCCACTQHAVLFRNHHEDEADPSHRRELKLHVVTLKLLHSPSVPEEDSQGTKKMSAFVTEEKSLRRCTN